MEKGRDALLHYGVKGMRWGVRKSEPSSGGTSAPKPRIPRASEDAKNVDRNLSKIDLGGTHALSNKELQDVVTRLNLEQQYHRLTAQQQASQMEAGHAAVKQLLGLGKTANDIHKFMRSPAGKALKAGFKAAKFGVKIYTHGPVGAAVDLARPKNHFTNVG